MAECDWAVLCDYAFQDIGRKTCLIGIFDRIFTATVPTVLLQAALGLKLLGNPAEQVAFRQLATFGGNVVISESSSLEVQIRMAGLQLPDFGVYGLNIYIGEALAKTVSFLVATPPPQQPAQPPQ
jgi:hypothetical protein